MLKAFTLLFVLIRGLFLFGQESKVTPYPMEESALLWEIRGDSVQKSCYLFGTMHLIEKEYFLFPKKLEKIVTKSDVLVMELAGLPDKSSAMQYLILKEGTFFDYFTPEQTDSILDWANKELHVSEEGFRASFSNMKPFVVVQMATQMHFMGKTESYEMTLEKLAKENQIEIRGLETVNQQVAIFDNLTKEQMTEIVMESIRKTDETLQLTEDMMKIYNRQQIDSLYMLIEEEGGVLSDEQNEFLDKRNENWIPQIEAIIREKKTLIAVGAGHLGGPNGVIRLLEKEGYTLVPVRL